MGGIRESPRTHAEVRLRPSSERPSNAPSHRAPEHATAMRAYMGPNGSSSGTDIPAESGVCRDGPASPSRSARALRPGAFGASVGGALRMAPRRRLIAGASPRWPEALARTVAEPMNQARPRQLPPCFLAGLRVGSGRCSRVPWLAPSLSVHHLTQDTAEADVAHRRVNGLCMPRGRAIAAAVARCAQMRAALQDLARDPDLRLTGVVTGLFARATWIIGNTAGLRGVVRVLRGVPVGRP